MRRSRVLQPWVERMQTESQVIWLCHRFDAAERCLESGSSRNNPRVVRLSSARQTLSAVHATETYLGAVPLLEIRDEELDYNSPAAAKSDRK
jgi:hypothetical protein